VVIKNLFNVTRCSRASADGGHKICKNRSFILCPSIKHFDTFFMAGLLNPELRSAEMAITLDPIHFSLSS